MAEGEQDLPTKYEPRINPELKILATNFEKSLLIRTKAAHINSSGVLNPDNIEVSDIPGLVATVATNGPKDTLDASAVISHLVQKGLHQVNQVKKYGKVLFVDCSSSLQGVQPEESFSALRSQVGESVLMEMRVAIQRSGIKLKGYGDLEVHLQIAQEMHQEFGSKYDYPELVFRVIQSLSAGRKGFWGSKDPVHLIPVFNFGSDLLPLANGAELGKKHLYQTIEDNLACEVARFYKLATAIRTLEPSHGFDRDGYGPYGRTIIVPEIVLYILGETAERNNFPNVAEKVTELGVDEIRDVYRIRGCNDFMWEDMVSGKLDYSIGHAFFRQPRGI